MTLLIGSLQLGLIYSLLALGVYVTFRILNTPDLTADGSFVLGMAVCAAMTTAGHPYLGIVLAIVAGALAGSVTGLFQTALGIHPILSGILTMSGLYSVNLLILGNRSNLSLIGVDTAFSIAQLLLPSLSKQAVLLLVSLAFCIVFSIILIWLMNTHLGLCVRATGNNPHMVSASSIDVSRTKVTALAIANGFVALSGAVLAQYQGYADISSGTGIITIGLASVIIGEVFFGRKSVTIGLLGAVFGGVLYRLIVALALQNDIFPAYMLKLVSAMIVVLALSIPRCKSAMAYYKIRKEAMADAQAQ
ncbi:ABC transporter permease [Bengtsoniella intestinalis]|uniref:ABC transporter permease n=1 Tax=Bengtsoniella intestinalis TaxID=3073143 RepID=UPI00391F88A7